MERLTHIVQVKRGNLWETVAAFTAQDVAQHYADFSRAVSNVHNNWGHLTFRVVHKDEWDKEVRQQKRWRKALANI